MSVSRLRSILYAAARALGDYNAVRRGRIGQRVERRLLGRLASRFLRAIVR